MQKFAAEFSAQLEREKPAKHATVIGLVGDLGAGKTTFTQGFLKKLGVKRRVISPTFLIIRSYPLLASRFTRAFHIDCYRLKKPAELFALGLQEILNDPKHIVLIEWPELIKKYLPRDTRWIEISHPKKGTHRTIKVS